MLIGDQAAKLREMAEQLNAETPKVAAPETNKKAMVYCITSGKGGVGKTSFTVNFAIALSRCNKKVVIIDADFGFSNVNILLGANSKYNMSHVLSGEKRLNEIMEECFPNVWHISGGAGLMDLVHMQEDKLASALAQLEPLEDVMDFILIDTGAGLSHNILQMIAASDRTILVMTSEPTSILDSYVMLKATAGLPVKPEIYALINKAESERSAIKTFESFSNVVKKHLGCNVDMLGFMPMDSKMTESILSLVPYTIKHPTKLLSMRIQSMANAVSRPEEGQKDAKGLKKFFGHFLTKGGNKDEYR